MKKIIEKVELWAEEKGIIAAGDCIAQSEKSVEEAGELREAIIYLDAFESVSNTTDAMLEMGDVLVTLIIQCKMQGWDLEECLEMAYDKISKRTGKMVDGFFIKDGE